MAVDSYKWLHRSLAGHYRDMELERRDPIPWTPLEELVERSTVAAITTGGVHLRDDEPFDVERERREPFWGDPTYRVLPRAVTSEDVEVTHLHYDPSDALADLDVLLPVPLLRELAEERRVQRVATRHYSVMGYQPEPAELLARHVPRMIETLREDEVDVVVLSPA